MSLKNNFNQALKEILGKDGIVNDESSKDQKKKAEHERAAEPVSRNIPEERTESVYREPAEDVSAPKTPLSSGSDVMGGVAADSAQQTTPFSQLSQYARQNGASEARNNSYDPYKKGAADGAGTPPPPPTRSNGSSQSADPDSPYYDTEETTVISRNTIIDGNIRSFANINIDGSVKGDVKITKNINVTGKVVGNIDCNNSVMTGASMQGNINSKGQVQIDRDSLLLGDISAQYLDLNGKVKGNIDVGGKAEFKTDAVILGNITASTITVLDGATIQGYVNTTFLQESSSSIFPEAIALGE